MPYGYNGKILKVNLSTKEVEVDEQDEYFYRTYMGGATLGAYYLLKEMGPKIDAFDPEALIVFAPSIVTGTPAPGFARYGVICKSPLTRTIADSQAGGFWGPELKFAGYDAIVVTGKASEPVYLWISDDKVEIRQAKHIWGKTTGEAQTTIRDELGDGKVRVLSIGPAGEKLVRFACILNECKHANGRNGMGAVMGSKNLKAIAVRGHEKIKIQDKETVLKWAKWFSSNFMDNPVNMGLHTLGTGEVLTVINEDGHLPTRNFQSGFFPEAEAIGAETIRSTLFQKAEGCYACPVRCKIVLKAEDPYHIDPSYGGPEYEALASLGSDCGISNLAAVAKAAELCNKYGLDVISTGATIAFAMECFEKGIIDQKDTGGLELRFGNADALVKTVESIANRKGFGDILAEGTKRAAQRLGKGAEKFAVQAKGLEVAMHDARVKGMVGFGYAVCPIGGDHVQVEHDTDFDFNAPEIFVEQAKSLGLLERYKTSGMDYKKIRTFCYLQYHFSFMDSLCLCVFAFAPVRAFKMAHLVDIASAVTGWELSLWEIMKVGERRVNMFKVFNKREGFTPEDDWLPDRFFEPLKDGPREGAICNREELKEMRGLYYELMNWDKTGSPTKAKLLELDLGWLV